MWQDWVIAACQWGFALALLPTLFGDRKPEVSTALVTAILASVVAVGQAGRKSHTINTFLHPSVSSFFATPAAPSSSLSLLSMVREISFFPG